MPVLIFKLQYDGTKYGGWQIQLNSITVQEIIQNAIHEIMGSPVNLIGAGRTDAGVHARAMVAHIELNFGMNIPKDKIVPAINSLLPKDIRIISSVITDKKFNSRFDAAAREYSYSIHTLESVFDRYYSTLVKYNMNFELLEKAASIFTGEHDFTSFSKNNPSTKSYVCNVLESKWERVDDNKLIYHIKADRFVYGMVRSLVGVMIDCARGKRTIENLIEVFNLGVRDDTSPMASPQGLVLEKIYYPKDLDFFN